MKRLFWFLAFYVIGVWPVQAQEVPLAFDLASDHIDITTEFNGERLVVYGVRRGKGQVYVTVEGPRSDMRVRRKGRILGAWVNKSSMTFKDMPIFYDYAVMEGASDTRGAESLEFVTEEKKDKNFDTFKDSLIRNKRATGLYPEAPSVLIFDPGGDLFRAEFDIPPNVPVGEYKARVFYEESNVTTSIEKDFRIAQVGMNANIYAFAHHYALPYGLLCIILALSAGWFSNRVRKRA